MSKIHKSCNIMVDSQSFVLINGQAENGNNALEQRVVSKPAVSIDLHKRFASRIIDDARKKAKAEAQEVASVIIETAKKEVKRIKQEAEEAKRELEETRHNAIKIRDEAYDEGYSKGFEEARNELLSQYSSFIEQFDSLLEEARRERNRQLDNLEHDIIDFTLDIAETILKYEMDRNNKAYESIIRSALSAIKETDRSVLRIHGDGEAAASSLKENSPPGMEWIRNLEIINDPSMKKGDCVLETSLGSIDTGLSTQIEQIRKSFKDLSRISVEE